MFSIFSAFMLYILRIGGTMIERIKEFFEIGPCECAAIALICLALIGIIERFGIDFLMGAY